MQSEIAILENTGEKYKDYLSFLNLPLNFDRECMPKSKVLLYESHSTLRSSRSQLLSREGYDVTSVSTFEKAVDVALSNSYDILIMNVSAPGLLDMSLAQFPPSLPVILVAEKSLAEELAQLSGRGIRSILFNPCSSVKLKNMVRQVLDNSQVLKESLRNEILLNLGAANHRLAIESGIDKFASTVVQIAADSTSADYVSIVVNGHNTNEPLIKSETGELRERWDQAIDQLSMINEPVIISDNCSGYPDIVACMSRVGISSIVRVPIVTKGNIVGAITKVKATGKRRFTESDLSFTSILAWWTSMAIDNTKVYLDYFKEYLHADRLLDHISFVQEKERKRVAVEIHDGVAQWLVGASYDIKLCSRLISESNYGELEQIIDKLRGVLQKSVKELRRAIANLPLPPLEELGLAGAITRLAERMLEEGIECRVVFPERLPVLTIAQQKTFYWLIQESLTNIQKHSQASKVLIEVAAFDDTISIRVSDNGVGFSVEKAMDSKLSLEHMGLLGMKERAELLNGCLDIESEPGKGTSIDLSFSLLPTELVTIARS